MDIEPVLDPSRPFHLLLPLDLPSSSLSLSSLSLLPLQAYTNFFRYLLSQEYIIYETHNLRRELLRAQEEVKRIQVRSPSLPFPSSLNFSELTLACVDVCTECATGDWSVPGTYRREVGYRWIYNRFVPSSTSSFSSAPFQV